MFCDLKDLSPNPHDPGAVAHVYNHGTKEAEAGGSRVKASLDHKVSPRAA